MKYLVVLFLMSLCLLGPGCARQHPLVLNYAMEPIPSSLDGKVYSMEEVERTLLTACRNKGWSASVVETGKINARADGTHKGGFAASAQNPGICLQIGAQRPAGIPT